MGIAYNVADSSGHISTLAPAGIVGLLISIYACLIRLSVPLLLDTTSVTLYVPLLSYSCVGFSSVDVVPSPNLQIILSGQLLLSLAKLIIPSQDSVIAASKAGTGGVLPSSHSQLILNPEYSRPLSATKRTVIAGPVEVSEAGGVIQ